MGVLAPGHVPPTPACRIGALAGVVVPVVDVLEEVGPLRPSQAEVGHADTPPTVAVAVAVLARPPVPVPPAVGVVDAVPAPVVLPGVGETPLPIDVLEADGRPVPLRVAHGVRRLVRGLPADEVPRTVLGVAPTKVVDVLGDVDGGPVGRVHVVGREPGAKVAETREPPARVVAAAPALPRPA